MRILWGLIAFCVVATAQAAEQPHFVFILCDDLGYGDLGCYGHPVIKTPHLDRLAEQGLKLTSCYSASPVCSPSRAGYLTGRTPNRAAIYDWIPLDSGVYLNTAELTLPEVLQKGGYATAHIGKWHLNSKFNGVEPTPGDHGFDYWFSTQNNAIPTHHNPKNFVRNGKRVGDLEGYSSEIIVSEALQWLADVPADKPFALFVWFHAPHEIVATPEEFTRPYGPPDDDKAVYYGSVAQVDHEVGRLMGALEQRGVTDNTFVFFTSDNGPETLNRYKTANHSYGSPGPLRGMKLHLHEAGYRVPGIMRWPARIKAGQVSDEPVCSLDLMPTVMELLGQAPPAELFLDGASFLPVLSGNPVERRHPLFWEYDRAIGGPWRTSLLSGRWKILADEPQQSFELFRIDQDIHEDSNLSDAEMQRLQELRVVLAERAAAVKKDGLAAEALRQAALRKSK